MTACDTMEVLANPEGDSRCNKYMHETKKSKPLNSHRVYVDCVSIKKKKKKTSVLEVTARFCYLSREKMPL